MENQRWDEISFKEVQKIWTVFLWPNRISPIEPVSYINQQGHIDMGIKHWAQPKFFAIKQAEQFLAVTSFYKTTENAVRLRGTWVDANYRGQRLGRLLLDQVIAEIKKKESSNTIWTMARITASSFYQKNGFRQVNEVHGYEFGPHLIMQRDP